MDLTDQINVALRGLSSGAIYALVGMGFNVTYATTSIFNFAQGEFVMVGAMLGIFFWVSAGWPMVAALVLAVGLTFLIGMAEERFAVRPAERFGHAAFGWFLSTLGASIILASAFALAMGSEPRNFPELFSDTPLRVGEVLVVPQQMVLIVLAVAAAVGLTVFYNRTLVGRAMGAIAQNRNAAALRGIPVARMSMLSFGLSAGIAAITGFMVAPLTTAYAAMGALFLFKGFIAAAVGGIPDIRGALVGGLILGLVEGFGSHYIGAGYREAVTFAVLLVVLLVKPNGLFGSRATTRTV
ncbi:MAG: branched-chain amino acid ABC transporter permease [Acidimicrobiia bacterium]